MTTLEFLILMLIIVLITGIAIVTPRGTWDDRAARQCQAQYGTYTYHPVGERYCVLQNGDIKGLRDDR